MAERNIAVVGLGNMGGPMAANLVKAGHAVSGFDVVPAACQAARSAGVSVAGSAREALAGADVVLTMLPAGKHVISVWTEIAPAVKAGTLLIDSSTIDIDSARKAHEIATGIGAAALDAPVSGGTRGAAAATLTFMVGGSAEGFARAEPILQRMGKNIFHCGGPGAGQAAKMCNNMMLGINMIGASEAFALAEKVGLAAETLFKVSSVSSGQSWALTSLCPWPGLVPSAPSSNGYKPGFSGALMLKDLRLAQEAATARGAATPLGAEAAQVYALFEALGRNGDDFTAIINLFRGKLAPGGAE